MSAHRIRLRRPWRCERLAKGVCWRRGFGWPSGPRPGETVWLVIEGFDAPGTVDLNGRTLCRLEESPGGRRLEVTRLLQPRNELAIPLDAIPPREDAVADIPPGEVWLEIAGEDGPDTPQPDSQGNFPAAEQSRALSAKTILREH